MNIGMTVCTPGPDIRKNQIEVTVPAIDVCVHLFKPETCGVVIEIGRGTNGLQAGSGVAVGARQLDTPPVRIACSDPFL